MRGIAMIEQVQGHLSECELQKIKEIIIGQYHRYLDLHDSPQFQAMFADEYTPHKQQYGISWAISSGFPSGHKILDFEVERLKYGRGHVRPCLIKKEMELLILNSSVNMEAEYLHERYKYNSNNFKNEKLFGYILFSVDHDKLKEITMCLPNEKGKVINKEILFDSKSPLILYEGGLSMSHLIPSNNRRV